MADCEGVSDDEVDILACRIPTIQPYRFEPLAKDARSDSDSSDSDSGEDGGEITPDPQGPDRGPNTTEQWCMRGECEDMPTVNERRCCHEYSKIGERLRPTDDQCITHHEGFLGNCLNPFVLETSIYDYVRDIGPFGDEETHSQLLRYIAYRRFVRFIFGILAKHDRKVLPACVVHRIRRQFPSDYYHGFQYSVY